MPSYGRAREDRVFFSRSRAPATKPTSGWWSILDLGRSEYRVARTGPVARGSPTFVSLTIAIRSCASGSRAMRSIRGRRARSISTALACGAVLQGQPRGARGSGTSPASRRTVGRSLPSAPTPVRANKLVLVLRKDKRCKHLGEDYRCAIYSIRPDACSTFPPASECCLSAREEELGIVDGARFG